MRRLGSGWWWLAGALVALVGCASYEPIAGDGQEHWTVTRDLIAYEPVGDHLGSVIFYPGGRVRPEAYQEMLAPLAEEGIALYIVPVPLDLAILSLERAADLIDSGRLPAARPRVVVGHSLGGVAAAAVAARRGDLVDALLLLASYPLDSDSLAERTDLPVASLVGDRDEVIDMERWNGAVALLPPNADTRVLEGANHAGFGSYGPQRGDGVATVGRDAQHEITREAIRALLEAAR